jgi:hypothetical protein
MGVRERVVKPATEKFCAGFFWFLILSTGEGGKRIRKIVWKPAEKTFQLENLELEIN